MKPQRVRKNQKGFNTALYLAYQSTSDELVFWPLFDVLFLSIAKGYSDASISLVFTVSLWTGIALKVAFYRPIKKLRAATSMIIATVLFLCAAMLITFGNAIWVIIVGQCLYMFAFSFQEMSAVFLQNAIKKDGSRPNYIRIKDIANGLYSLISLVSIFFLNSLCNITMMLPMYICIGFCINSLIMALCLYRYDNTDNLVINNAGTVKPTYKKIDGSAICCLILSALAVLIMGLGMDNLRIAIKSDLAAIFDNQKVVFYFSMMLIVNRIIKCLGNAVDIFYTRKKYTKKDYLSIYVVIIALTPVLGLVSCFTSGYFPAILASLSYFAIVFVFDPFCTRISKMLIEYMNPENMKILIYLNTTVRDVAKALVSSVITIIIAYGNMMGVMILLSVIALVLLVFYIIYKKKLVRKFNNRVYTKWTKADTAGVDSLMVAMAVLLCYGNVELSETFVPLQLGSKLDEINKISDIYKDVYFRGIEEFNCQTLKEYSDKGRLCAVQTRKNGEDIWLPVLYVDADGIVLYSIEDKWIFANEDLQINKMCSIVV